MKNSKKIKKKIAQDSDAFEVIKRIVKENLPKHKKTFSVALFWMVIGAAATAGVAWLTRSVINSVFIDGGMAGIFSVSAALAAVFFLRGISEYFADINLVKIRAGIRSEYLGKAFDILMRSKMQNLRGENPARIATKIYKQSLAVSRIFLMVSLDLVKTILTLIGLALVMIIQQPILSLAIVIVAPVIFFFMAKLNRRIRELAKGEAALEGGVVAVISEAIDGAPVVKSFQIEKKAAQSVKNSINKLERRMIKLNRIIASTSPIMESLGALIIILVLVYTGLQSGNSTQAPGNLASFIVAFLLAYAPAKKLARFQLSVTRLLKPTNQLYDFLDHTETEEIQFVDREAPSELPKRSGKGVSISFQGVQFSYRKRPALRGVSFDIESGQRVAIVGKSGSGKSTIANLLLGFYTDYEGSIKIGGVELNQIPIAKLREIISYVGQDTFLFEDTIKQNILLGDQSASDEALLKVVNRAHVDEFASNFPDKLDTNVGGAGSLLSGGQKQRIAIARALLKDAPIILWDEATSALDGTTEAFIEEAALEIFEDRTQIFISHRLSTAVKADQVIMLNEGKLFAIGEHDKLVEENDEYRKMFSL